MSPVHLFALMLLLTFPLVGGPLDDLKINFQTRCDFAEADRDLQLKKLDTSYLAALDRQVEKTKATGKLDAVIPFINEAQAIKNAARAAGLALPSPTSGENHAQDPARSDRSLPSDRNTETPGGNAATETPLPEGASLELQQMRAKHAEARAKILKSHAEALDSLADKMEAALKSKEQEFTKAGKFDDALAAKKMREDLASDEDLARARDQLAASKPAIKTEEWRSLLTEPMDIVSKGMYEVLTADQAIPGTKLADFLGGFVNSLKSLKEKPQEILVAIPNSIVDFKLNSLISQARGKIHLANPGGSVHFKLHAGNKLIFEKVIKGEVATVPFDISFPATKSIRLETDQMGAETHDWSAWIAPEIR